MNRLVVDTSVWIDRLRGRITEQTIWLQRTWAVHDIIVPDVVLLELLQGARNDRVAGILEREMRLLWIVSTLDDKLINQAAANSRALRAVGITLRRQFDLLIATYCITENVPLLHADRDFTRLRQHLPLREAGPASTLH